MPLLPEIRLATRLYFSQQGKGRHSRPAVRVALAAMTVGVMIMLLTLCIVVGFKRTVTQKVTGFDAHIQLISFKANDSYDLDPIPVTDSLLTALNELEHVVSVSPFITKPGMLKTDSAFVGVVLKGTDYWSFFATNLTEGHLPQADQEILLSANVARQLQLHVNDPVFSYFIDGKDVRARKFTLCGIYKTGFAQYDDLFVLTNLSTMRSLQRWDSCLYSGVDILLDDINHTETVEDALIDVSFDYTDEDNYPIFMSRPVLEKESKIFMWLDLFDMNVAIIIVLMLIVAGFSIVSSLIILLLESVQLIGTLKALGANNGFIRRIFLTQASMLIAKGVFWGNILGLGLACAQYFGQFIPLDATTYFMDIVPIAFPWTWLILMNLATIVLSFAVLLLPSMIIAKINPAKVMHFE